MMCIYVHIYVYINFYDITECLSKTILTLYQDKLWVLQKFLRNFLSGILNSQETNYAKFSVHEIKEYQCYSTIPERD